ncbi:YceI family protein [Spongiivirga citrea]|uniref:YceI family protein n=1 Tax=Spongiivirga citrea TaxID=1481457 RepID=A0A6M0CKH9_9FLAO|nr:YceI family protein [Spongiivirga citrea]NER18475.1 YceI family protein [Spongiivirga citrea]
MLRVLCTLFLVTTTIVTAQNKYETKNGIVSFNASTPLENITAENIRVKALLNTDTGEFAALLYVRQFVFPNALMQEHFNENYLESDKFPKATFLGKLSDFDLKKPEGKYILKGSFMIHGVEQSVETTVDIDTQDEHLKLSSSFIIKPENHDIKVPKLVFKKIAQEVAVKVDCLLKEIEK